MIMTAEELRVVREMARKLFKEEFESEEMTVEQAFVQGYICSREITLKELGIDKLEEQFGKDL